MDVAPLQLGSQATVPASIPLPAEQSAQNRQLIQAVHAVNGAELFGEDRELTFALDRGTQRAVIRLVNRKTREVIRQIPPESVLRVAEAMRIE
jgi:uncharacterized FlaG/YvyC family protein